MHSSIELIKSRMLSGWHDADLMDIRKVCVHWSLTNLCFEITVKALRAMSDAQQKKPPMNGGKEGDNNTMETLWLSVFFQ